jgi:hypothetical protein
MREWTFIPREMQADAFARMSPGRFGGRLRVGEGDVRLYSLPNKDRPPDQKDKLFEPD